MCFQREQMNGAKRKGETSSRLRRYRPTAVATVTKFLGTIKLFCGDVFSDDFCGYARYHAVIGHIFHHHGVCTNHHIVAYADRAEHSCARRHINVVAKHWNFIPPRLAAERCPLPNQAVLADNAAGVNDDSYASVSELRTPPLFYKMLV